MKCFICHKECDYYYRVFTITGSKPAAVSRVVCVDCYSVLKRVSMPCPMCGGHTLYQVDEEFYICKNEGCKKGLLSKKD